MSDESHSISREESSLQSVSELPQTGIKKKEREPETTRRFEVDSENSLDAKLKEFFTDESDDVPALRRTKKRSLPLVEETAPPPKPCKGKECTKKAMPTKSFCNECYVKEKLEAQGVKMPKVSCSEMIWDEKTNCVTLDVLKKEEFATKMCTARDCERVAVGQCRFKFLSGLYRGCHQLVCYEHISTFLKVRASKYKSEIIEKGEVNLIDYQVRCTTCINRLLNIVSIVCILVTLLVFILVIVATLWKRTQQ